LGEGDNSEGDVIDSGYCPLRYLVEYGSAGMTCTVDGIGQLELGMWVEWDVPSREWEYEGDNTVLVALG
jgi:hypothetical protein